MLLTYAYNPCCLSSHRRDRDLQGMSDSVPREVPRGVVRCVVMTRAGGKWCHSSPCSRELRQMRWMPHQCGEQRGISSAVGPACEHSPDLWETRKEHWEFGPCLRWRRNLDLGSHHRLCSQSAWYFTGCFSNCFQTWGQWAQSFKSRLDSCSLVCLYPCELFSLLAVCFGQKKTLHTHDSASQKFFPST